VVFGLVRARQAGIFVEETAIQGGVNYLVATMPSEQMLSATWQLDRLAFEHFVLAVAGEGSQGGVLGLYELRDHLNPWARAFLAMGIETLSPGDNRVDVIISDLEAGAMRSATGTFWEENAQGRVNMSTPVFASAVVVYALAQHDPASATIPEAVRYLVAHRTADGGWASTYETAWTLLALTEVMKGTGELVGDFSFTAALNGGQLVTGDAGGDAQLNPVTASVPVSELYSDEPNALLIQRESGPGRLYYNAHLNVVRPVEDVAPLNAGIGLSRAYCQLPGQGEVSSDDCLPLQSVVAGELVTVRLVLTLKEGAYYLVVEDSIPAGAEVLDTRLKTSQQGVATFDPRSPFDAGWGWWYFHAPQIYDDRIAWAADFLPAGTYELVYTLVLNQPGQYHSLPARAWEFYFPEVQGHSAGGVFEILE
jgi:uncharacterized protein YfaS (alpha-2-macroglobulin family)